MRPSSSKPTSYAYWNACRLPVMIMSSSRSTRNLTARPVFRASIAATQANSDICVSLPPKPPPIRRHSTTTSWAAIEQRTRDHLLDFAGMLGRAVDAHAAVLLRHGQRHLALEVEMVLPAARASPGEAVRRARERGRRVAPHDMRGRQHPGLRGDGLVDGEDRRQRFEVEAGQLRRLARGIHGGGRDREHRLAGEQHDAIGQDRIVVLNRADVVDPRNIGGRDHRDDVRRGPHGIEVERPDAAVRNGTLAHGGVQRAARLRNVVGVRCGAGDVQVCRIVGERRTDDRFVGASGSARVRCVHRGAAAVMRAPRTRASGRARHSDQFPSHARSDGPASPASRGDNRPSRACR